MIDAIRPYLELIYFVTGGPLLALLAFFALRQIAVAKETSRIASQREAYRLASEQVRFFVDQIVPSINELNFKIEKTQSQGWFDGDIFVDSKSIRVTRGPSIRGDEASDKFLQFVTEFSVLVNRLEAFSVFFVSGVAAESIAYSSVGATFERSVKKLMPLIIVQASGKNYTNVLNLFIMWHNRLEKEKLEAQKSNIQSKLTSLQDMKITPVGT